MKKPTLLTAVDIERRAELMLESMAKDPQFNMEIYHAPEKPSRTHAPCRTCKRVYPIGDLEPWGVCPNCQ